MGDWLPSFVLTQLVEVPLLVWWLRGTRARGWVAFGASAITHPILWFVIRPLLAPISPVAYVLAGETLAVVVEALYLARFGAPDALLASVAANASSWATGRALMALVRALSA